jgi:hypothetical protein
MTIEKTFKTAEDFGGYWLKAMNDFQGHEGEPLFQGNVYKDNKKIGFFSQDSWGGMDRLDCDTKEQQKELEDFADKLMKRKFESYSSFFAEIATEIDRRKFYQRKCRTKICIRVAKHTKDQFFEWGQKWSEASQEKWRAHFDKKYGEYIIINEELKK